MKPQKNHYELKREYEAIEKERPGSLFEYISQGMQDGTVSIFELRQAGLVAKNIIHTTCGYDLTPTHLTGYIENLLRLTMASLLPTAQSQACIQGMYWMVDREILSKACKHAGEYHRYLYTVAEDIWSLRVCPPVWTTANVRELRKKALKSFKASPSPDTARAVAISLLSPSEAQIAIETGQDLSPAQIRTALHRSPSPTYEKAIAVYADALEHGDHK